MSNEHLDEAARILRAAASTLEEASAVKSHVLSHATIAAAKEGVPTLVEVAMSELRRA